MGLPSKKLTKSSKKRRASHFALNRIQLTYCLKCKKPIRSHHVCQFCGTYAGKEIVKIKIDKKKKKKEEKETKAAETKKEKQKKKE